VPRSNRSRRGAQQPEPEGIDLSRALAGALHTEQRQDGIWNVQPVSAASAVKVYVCPGCGLDIVPGTQHIVTWRADGLMGEADDLASRRHWHSHCWKIR
jgi:hypothetical protein